MIAVLPSRRTVLPHSDRFIGRIDECGRSGVEKYTLIHAIHDVRDRHTPLEVVHDGGPAVAEPEAASLSSPGGKLRAAQGVADSPADGDAKDKVVSVRLLPEDDVGHRWR